ncbi:MAG TPA: hypothetical protein VGF67_21300 [Ktedonobacteraceae bacterium]|jgi:hypothetical protein
MKLEQGGEVAQAYLNRQVRDILQIPESITALVSKFLQLRLGLVGGGTRKAVREAQQPPSQNALYAYAQQLISNLDGFLDSDTTHHRVTIEQTSDLTECTVEFVRSEHAFEPIIKVVPSQNRQALRRLQQNLQQECSQWVYVQRGLKIFRPSRISLYKEPHLINWTCTQAMYDADDMIAELLSMERRPHAGQRSSVPGN